ncbi:MAG: hypothetical protein EPN70_13460 [Paraburkholderia sp.]|uniref:alanine racemase n=1 Tax=Paraburkholderia sp. TaxID=1926495 RepID=UPI0012053115|nr:alanine racemase [Paraburkholderia sp.]TAM03729.1 MAG: hypothetical protein EPN70_13460 [Paraburkholderia sp.]
MGRWDASYSQTNTAISMVSLLRFGYLTVIDEMSCPDFIEVGCDPELDIAHTFGTPVFVYDASQIELNYNELDALCGGRVEIFFSLKANPNVSVAAQLRLLGSGAEVSSLTELNTALAAGFAPRDIIFVGPFKTDGELRAAVEARIASIVVDSFEEMLRLSALSRELDRQVPVLLRINPNFKMDEAPIKMSGVATQFGFPEDVIFDHPAALRQSGLNILGIHVYNGSRVLRRELRDRTELLTRSDDTDRKRSQSARSEPDARTRRPRNRRARMERRTATEPASARVCCRCGRWAVPSELPAASASRQRGAVSAGPRPRR